MNRRKFFSNLVGSVAVLVTAHALPLQRVRRVIEGSDEFATFLIMESGKIYPHAFKRSPWIELIRRGEFPANMGETLRQL